MFKISPISVFPVFPQNCSLQSQLLFLYTKLVTNTFLLPQLPSLHIYPDLTHALDPPLFFPLFYFLNYESMTTRLQEIWKMQNRVIYSSTVYYSYFKVDKIRFLVRVSISNSEKLIE